jgi:hypothetical protein
MTQGVLARSTAARVRRSHASCGLSAAMDRSVESVMMVAGP